MWKYTIFLKLNWHILFDIYIYTYTYTYIIITYTYIFILCTLGTNGLINARCFRQMLPHVLHHHVGTRLGGRRQGGRLLPHHQGPRKVPRHNLQDLLRRDGWEKGSVCVCVCVCVCVYVWLFVRAGVGLFLEKARFTSKCVELNSERLASFKLSKSKIVRLSNSK